ncbi:MAG: hypothetical protein ACOY82_04735 [Pseudomonadota bacterium]
MNIHEDPFGKFSDDEKRLEAIKLRERRLLWLGLAYCASIVLVFLFGHPSADHLRLLPVLIQGLMR